MTNANDKEVVAKEFVGWLTNDALPTTSKILSELKKINAEKESKALIAELNKTEQP